MRRTAVVEIIDLLKRIELTIHFSNNPTECLGVINPIWGWSGHKC